MSQEFTVTAEDVGIRLDVFLTRMLDGFSRTHTQAAVEAGQVLVNNKPSTSHYKLRDADVVMVTAEKPQMKIIMTPRPDIKLNVVYEDDEVIVVDKPSGMLTHPAVPTDDTSLAHALLGRMPAIAKIGDSPERPGIVHRLDKDASGLIVVAKTQKSFLALKQQFQDHEIEKAYTVLVDGETPEDAATISLAIGRKKGDGKMAARHTPKEGDREAITHYHVEKRLPKTTLLTVRIETGRTHQIRAHMHAIGCSVVGDNLYGTNREGRLESPRLFLHAKSLTITHPKSGERMTFTSPLPAELQTVLDGLEPKK